jgi:hypothetical protein
MVNDVMVTVPVLATATFSTAASAPCLIAAKEIDTEAPPVPEAEMLVAARYTRAEVPRTRAIRTITSMYVDTALRALGSKLDLVSIGIDKEERLSRGMRA